MGRRGLAINTTTQEYQAIAENLFGRRDIYASVAEITPDNVVAEVNSALVFHLQNLMEEDYLYWYRRGVTPVLSRKKDRNSFVLNKVNVAIAEQVVDFKNGYMMTEPCFYVARNNAAQSKIDRLNEYLYRSGKQQADNKIIDWFHTVGKAALFVEPSDDDETPYRAYALDPRSAFVVYSLKPGNRPVMGINIVISGETLLVDAYTEDTVYRLEGSFNGRQVTAYPDYESLSTRIIKVEPNVLRKIPIIEYRYNSVNMGAFEQAVSLINAVARIQSDRLDGVDQFIQSLLVLYNAEMPEGETAESIKKMGMIILKSQGENKADIKILNEQLDQDQTQTLLDSIYEEIYSICAMPRVGEGTTYDTTGAAVMASQGWFQADAAARSCSDLFRESNKYFDEIVLSILQSKGLLDIEISDFDLHFIRNESAGIQSKAQAFNTLLASGLHPELAAAKSGVSNDPAGDIKRSEKYLTMIWGNPNKVDEVEEQTDGQGEAEIIEEDNANGEDETGGAV